MSNEMIAILGVGVALGLFNWRVSRSDKADVQKHFARIDKDLDEVKSRLNWLVDRVTDLTGRVGRIEGILTRHGEPAPHTETGESSS